MTDQTPTENTIEVQPFAVLSVVADGVLPSTVDEQIADFLSDFIELPVPPNILGNLSKYVTPYLLKRMPWMPDAIASIEAAAEDESSLPEGVVADSFPGYVAYMNRTYAAMQKIIDEHGDLLYVQPLDEDEQTEFRKNLVSTVLGGDN
jgi:hypothetical protein